MRANRAQGEQDGWGGSAGGEEGGGGVPRRGLEEKLEIEFWRGDWRNSEYCWPFSSIIHRNREEGRVLPPPRWFIASNIHKCTIYQHIYLSYLNLPHMTINRCQTIKRCRLSLPWSLPGKIWKSIIWARPWGDRGISDMLADRVRKGCRLACSESRKEVGPRVIESRHFCVLVWIGWEVHLPGPGEIVWILSKRLELPILEQPDPGYLATK